MPDLSDTSNRPELVSLIQKLLVQVEPERRAGVIRKVALELAELTLPYLPTSLAGELRVARKFQTGGASKEELLEARSNAWTYVTGLACGVGPRDGSAAQIVMACLEADPSRFTEEMLFEHGQRVVSGGASFQAIRGVFEAALEIESQGHP
jgi:hypothetical protein